MLGAIGVSGHANQMFHKFIELLADVLLGLLAILVPIFAIMISVLAKAIEAGRRRLASIIKDIFSDIEEVKKRSASSPEATISELQKAIRKYRWRRLRAQLQGFLLSTRAAIYYPGLCFLASMGLLVSPLSKPVTAAIAASDVWLTVASCCLTVFGGMLLCAVLETVRTFAAAYESPVVPNTPTLEVRFSQSYTSVAVWPAGSEQEFQLVLINTGDYLAERVMVSVLLPPQFEVSKKAGGARLVRQSKEREGSKYAGFMAVFWNLDQLHGRLNFLLDPVEVRSAGEKGEYVIATRVQLAGIPIISGELKIIVN